jgi:hypothetical protein
MTPTPHGHEIRIREVAYFLWEQEGRPEGQAERHWDLASALVTVKPAVESPKKKKAPAAKVRKAA